MTKYNSNYITIAKYNSNYCTRCESSQRYISKLIILQSQNKLLLYYNQKI